MRSKIVGRRGSRLDLWQNGQHRAINLHAAARSSDVTKCRPIFLRSKLLPKLSINNKATSIEKQPSVCHHRCQRTLVAYNVKSTTKSSSRTVQDLYSVNQAMSMFKFAAVRKRRIVVSDSDDEDSQSKGAAQAVRILMTR
jgi:hypothetical protein